MDWCKKDAQATRVGPWKSGRKSISPCTHVLYFVFSQNGKHLCPWFQAEVRLLSMEVTNINACLFSWCWKLTQRKIIRKKKQERVITKTDWNKNWEPHHYVHQYSWIPPSGHSVITTILFWRKGKLCQSYLLKKNLKKATPLTRPELCDPLVLIELTGFHCIWNFDSDFAVLNKIDFYRL